VHATITICHSKVFEFSDKFQRCAVYVMVGGNRRSIPEGVIWDSELVYFSQAPRAGGPNWYVSSSALICRF